MKKKINLVYWAERKNYGDYLSPFIVQKLTGCKVRAKDVCYLQKPLTIILRDFLKKGHLNLRFSHRFLPFEKNYVCIGSIMGQGNNNSHYWGTGFLRKTEGSVPGIIHAVRGYLSKEIVLKNKKNHLNKIEGDIAVGDPALLLPMFIPPLKTKTNKYGIIPHYVDYNYFNDNFGDKYLIVDLSSSNVEKITNEITSCERILSTSLHGLIVAHAYNIPALWIERNEILPGSNGFKFKDYFSTVGLAYEPFRNVKTLLNNQRNLDKLFNDNIILALPTVNLEDIRNRLLKAAPFTLKEMYKTYFSCPK